MQGDVCQKLCDDAAPKAVIIIRILTGTIFLSEGIQKFLFAEELGVGRFAKIGIINPTVAAPFVGGVEIVCGSLLLLGLLTRLATMPLLIDMAVAITSTKGKFIISGALWKFAHEARTDYSMIMCLIFLMIVGAGPISIDSFLGKKLKMRNSEHS